VTPEAVEPVVGPEELAAVRELVLRAHPDVVPELVTGASVDELVASVEPARAAFRRVAESVREVVPRVPAGDTPALAVDVGHLPAAEKIRRGLASRG
jgi:hypothetical protein